MLGKDYPSLLECLISSIPREIQLPSGQEGYFQESGPTPHYENDQRSARRTNIRTLGVMTVERWLPAAERDPKPVLIYTKDFSKNGFGFVGAREYYPGEVVKVILATFWMRVTLKRCRRLGPACFECGGVLTSQHEPSLEAFDGLV